ncbi:MAG: U32 family peptidase [Bacteroidales bacterium]|nr:U32 family peptidase [Bacteroidales bacterium]
MTPSFARPWPRQKTSDLKRNKLEILSPAGNFECLRAAIQGGADSVYFGVGKLNMRSHSANNFAPEDLAEVVRQCREAGVRAYLTLNIVLYPEDLQPMREALDAARAAGVDAVIASDIAAIEYSRSIGLEVHISTQLNISNIEALRFYARWADVVVLARELNLDQVREISSAIESEHICGPSGEPVRIEMFAHGALCMAVSGKCYLSLHAYGSSANRGACMQICRRGYEVKDLETGYTLDIDNKYIMSPKDLCTIEFLQLMADSGVSVFKIEGRARSAEYVKRCTECYRQAADAIAGGRYTPELAGSLKDSLAEVFNRGFWDGYYQGAYLGQWSDIYGSHATRRKVYCGKVSNWFDRINVAEISVEAVPLNVGDDILVIGATSGVTELTVSDMRVNLKPCSRAEKGERCSVAIPAAPGTEHVRRGDKVYIWVTSQTEG